jgi:tRNA-splicing ligase RtcB
MNNQDLIRLGVPQGDAVKLAYEHMRSLFARGFDREQVEADIFNIVANPPAFFADELRAPLARAIYRPAFTPRAELPLRRLRSEGSAVGREALPRSAFAPWRQ